MASGRAYRGVNTLTLWMAAEAKRHESACWGTFRQWKELGGHVNRGERGTRIIFWNIVTETATDQDTGEETEERRFFARQYTVFNLDQCGGNLDRFRVTRPVRDFIDFAPAEEAIKATGADVRHSGGHAYYNRRDDYIALPMKESFNTSSGYYSTALHELSHWTGHESRLDRLGKFVRYGDQSYAAEELVAELGAAFLTATLGVPNERTLQNAAAYVADWLQVLRFRSPGHCHGRKCCCGCFRLHPIVQPSRTAGRSGCNPLLNDGNPVKLGTTYLALNAFHP